MDLMRRGCLLTMFRDSRREPCDASFTTKKKRKKKSQSAMDEEYRCYEYCTLIGKVLIK